MKCPQCQAEVEASADSCFHCGHVLRPQTQNLRKGSLLAGRYEVLAPLGKGGMGMVYKARDHKLEETVAIKVLRPEVASDPDMERRFRTEIRLARRVRHRNVCGIHEYGEDGSLRYIAMEYIEGTDLRKIITERGALPVDQAFEVCIRVAEGLQAIHEAGIIHRDLKTANLMVDGQGTVRLMDFGIAKQAGGDATLGATAAGLVIGTPEYMSPEQARGEKLDFRSDIYSLGVLSYEIFTGQVPFRGETPIATIFKHLQDPPPLDGPTVKALPVELLGVLRVALEKTPDGRYTTAAEYARALFQARQAAGIAPPAASVTPRPSNLSPAGPLTPAAALTPGEILPALRPTPRPVPRSTSSPAPEPTPRPVTPVGTPPVEAPATANSPAATVRPVVSPTVMAPGPGDHEVPPTRALVSAPPTRRGLSPAVMAGAGLLLAAGAVGLVTLPGRGSRPGPAAPPAVSSPEPSASAAPGTLAPGSGGTLVIDALPWGEVVGISAASGEKQSLGAGSHYTPLAVRLPPGEYTVEVRNPSFPRPVTLQAAIATGKVETRVAEFRRVEAAAYFRRSGLQP